MKYLISILIFVMLSASCAFADNIGFVNMQKGEYKKISFNNKKELTALELISSLTDGQMIVEQHPFQIN